MTNRFAIAGLLAIALAVTATAASAQTLEKKNYNYSEWTKGRFSEAVTVTGPGKMIFLAGVGAEDEHGPPGQSAPILHLGKPYEQCLYAYDKIKRWCSPTRLQVADMRSFRVQTLADSYLRQFVLATEVQ